MKKRFRPALASRTGRRKDSFHRLQGKRLKIGLLGGSFNPAHQGHIHLSRLALRLLGLDAVWWLVTPQNPLKSAEALAPIARRQNEAQALIQQAGLSSRVGVSTIEAEFGTHFTIDSLTQLRLRLPGLKLVWLMGADGFAEFHRWQQWQKIITLVPMAVFARPPFQHRPISNPTARVFAAARRKGTRSAIGLATQSAPAWVALPTALNPLSSTQIRRGTTGWHGQCD